jgi:hypothetical protein
MKVINGKIFKKDLQKAVAMLTTAGLSPILYHYTHVSGALDILEDMKFHLSPAIGTNSDMAPGCKLYYLSCSRIKFGGYSRSKVYNSGVHFVLDGVKLAQKYSGSPMDYWGDTWRKALLDDTKNKNVSIDKLFEDYLGKDENEDRVFSDEPTIPVQKYVKEVHIFLKPETGRDFYSVDYQKIMKIMRICMSSGIEVYMYDDLSHFKNQYKAKAIPFTEVKKPDSKEEIRPRSRFGNENRWDYVLQIYYSKDLKDLDKYAYNNAWDLQSDYRFKEIVTRIKNDIHNTRSGSKESKEELTKILKLFKAEGCKTVEEFVAVLAKKAAVLIEKSKKAA